METIIFVGGEASIVVFLRLMNSPKFMIIRVVVHKVNPSVFLWEQDHSKWESGCLRQMRKPQSSVVEFMRVRLK